MPILTSFPFNSHVSSGTGWAKPEVQFTSSHSPMAYFRRLNVIFGFCVWTSAKHRKNKYLEWIDKPSWNNRTTIPRWNYSFTYVNHTSRVQFNQKNLVAFQINTFKSLEDFILICMYPVGIKSTYGAELVTCCWVIVLYFLSKITMIRIKFCFKRDGFPRYVEWVEVIHLSYWVLLGILQITDRNIFLMILLFFFVKFHSGI